MRILSSLLLCFFSMLVWAQETTVSYPPLTDRAEVTVLTVGTGSELYTLFGHTALRVYDPLSRIDRVYNYGLFDFRTPNFYSKFIKGELLYFGGYEDYREFVLGYAYEDRPVYEQHILLSDEQKQALWQLLNQSLEPDQKFYTYKFIRQNCTTKVVDLLNKVLKEPIAVAIYPDDATYRSVLNEPLKGHFFEKLGINLLFSSQLDDKPTTLFLPDKLMQGLNATAKNGMPLVDKTAAVYERQETASKAWWNSYAFFCGIVLLLGALMRYSWMRVGYFIGMGLLGCLLVFVSLYSSHIELYLNDTPLLCNPLFLLIPVLAYQKRWGRFPLIIFALCALSLLLYVLINAFSEKLIITLPLVLLGSWTLLLQLKQQKSGGKL